MPRARLRILLAAVVLGIVALAGCGSDASSGVDGALPARTVTSGEVTVAIQPTSIGEDGAVFALSFDTHSVDLDLDVARSARLEVDGRLWTPATWKGDAPGGHHRSGELSFRPGGPARGDAVLTIDAPSGRLTADWTLPGSAER